MAHGLFPSMLVQAICFGSKILKQLFYRLRIKLNCVNTMSHTTVSVAMQHICERNIVVRPVI
jgi:hypothetical protein